jgi:hypothetical protein
VNSVCSIARPIHQWAEGEALDDILAETDMAPGDFIRNCKQLVDLLRQIEDVAEGGAGENCSWIVRRCASATVQSPENGSTRALRAVTSSVSAVAPAHASGPQALDTSLPKVASTPYASGGSERIASRSTCCCPDSAKT